MDKFLEQLTDNFREINEIYNFAGSASFDASEAESAAEIMAETIALIEKNSKELENFSGGDILLGNLDRLKFLAVSVYKSIPHLTKADEILSAIDTDMGEVIDIYLDVLAPE